MDIRSSRKHQVIGASTGWGAQIRTTEHGPEAIKHLKIIEALQASRDISWKNIIYPNERFANDESPTPQDCLQHVLDINQKLCNEVSDTVQNGGFPCVIGGDHSIAVGTWSGVTQAMNANEEFGLIWFDAHLDAHTPLTTPSQAIHGMPTAILMGESFPELTNIGNAGATIKPEHLVVIGARSYEEGELKFLNDRGATIIYATDIHAHGFENMLKKAIEKVSTGTKGFGLSMDLDGFDPHDAPAVGSPEQGGLSKEMVLPHLHLLRDHPKFSGFEITEFNPHKDIDHKTSRLLKDVMIALIEEQGK